MKSLKLTHYDLHHDSSLKKYLKCISWKYNSKRKLDATDLVPSPTKYYKYFIASYITYANEKKKLLALASIPLHMDDFQCCEVPSRERKYSYSVMW